MIATTQRLFYDGSNDSKGRFLEFMIETGGDLQKAGDKWHKEVVRRFIAANVLPTDMRRGVEPMLSHVGIVLEETLPDDHMFRSVELNGCSIVGDPHDTFWYDLLDVRRQPIARIYFFPGHPIDHKPRGAFIELA